MPERWGCTTPQRGRKRKPFAKVVLLTMSPNAGRYAVESGTARWGMYDALEDAQKLADRLNEITR